MKFRGPQALYNRRQKTIVCPTKTIAAPQRNEELVIQAFLPVLFLNALQFFFHHVGEIVDVA
jgi:hypothetical protein